MIAILFSSVFPWVSGAQYYIDIKNPNCVDGGPGSPTIPWCLIQEGFARAQAGDTVFVEPGIYRLDTDLVVTQSGTSSESIRMIARSNAQDIIGKGNGDFDSYRDYQVFVITPEDPLLGGRIDGESKHITFDGANYWHLEGFWFSKIALQFIDTEGVELRHVLSYVSPRKTMGFDHNGDCNTGGDTVSESMFQSSSNFIVDHVEFWTMMFDRNMIGNRISNSDYPGWGNCDLHDTLSNAVLYLSGNSHDFEIKNSFFYGGRNVRMVSSGHDGLIEKNYYFFGQEHIGALANAQGITINRNVIGPMRQQATYVVPDCVDGSPRDVARDIYIYNNLMIDLLGVDVLPDCNEAAETIFLRNNLRISGKASTTGYEIGKIVMETVNSDYNAVFGYPQVESDTYFWRVKVYPDPGPNIFYSLAAWQTQSDYPQLLQDPHSLYADPNFMTAPDDLYRNLGSDDNDFPPIYTALTNFESHCGWIDDDYGTNGAYDVVYSNCEYPFRMSHFADLTLHPDSLLIDRGDPDFGTDFPGEQIDIGPFEFEEGGGADIPCTDLGGQCLADCGQYRVCWDEPDGFCESGVCCIGSCNPTPRPPGGSPLLAPLLKSEADRHGSLGYVLAEQVHRDRARVKAEFNFLTWVLIAGALAVASVWFFFEKRKRIRRSFY